MTSTGFVCLQEEYNVEHILVQCVFARLVWWQVFQALGLVCPAPAPNSTLENWWTSNRCSVRAVKRVKRDFDALVILTCWSLWKHRNSWVFEAAGQHFSVEQLVARVLSELRQWAEVRRGVSGVFTHAARK